MARLAQHAIDFAKAAADLVGLDLQQGGASLASVALGIEIDELVRNGNIVHLALRFLRCCGFYLRQQGSDPPLHFVHEMLNSLQHRSC